MLQLVYRIEKKDSHTLAVHLEEKGVKRVLYLSHLQMGSDRAVLDALIAIHKRSAQVIRSVDTSPFQCISLNAEQAQTIVPLLAKTGKLSFQKKLLSLRSSSLTVSFKGKKLSQSSCHIEAFAGEIPFRQAQLLFPGKLPWAIFQEEICFLSSSVSFIWLERFLQGPLVLEGALLKKFLQEEPFVVWEEEICHKRNVRPRVVLQDVSGCFAHLWMDYPEGSVCFHDLHPLVGGAPRLKQEELFWEKDLVEAGFIRKVVGTTHYFCPADQVFSTLQFLLELGWSVFDHAGKKVFLQTHLNVSIEEKGDKIVCSGDIVFQDKKGSLLQPLGRLFTPLDAHSVGLVDHKALSDWKPLVEQGGCLPKHSLGLLTPFLSSPEVSWEEELKVKLSRFVEREQGENPPSDFQGELLAYQKKGFAWLKSLYGSGFSAFLADEMGLGKTVQVLAFLSEVKKMSLIVAPTSLLCNWARECEKFLPNSSLYLHTGKDRCRDVAQMKSYSLVLTSYALLRQDEELWKECCFEVVVLDESQMIKNAKSQSALAACRLKSHFRICLSGTPIENRLEEFASQFSFLLPRLLSAKDTAPRMLQKTRPFFLRRSKSDVDIDLPEKMEQIVWLEPSEEQQAMYDSYLPGREFVSKIEREGAAAHRFEILEAILRLRQICASPKLVSSACSGVKIERLKEEMEELRDRKVLIYSQFTSLLALLKTELSSHKLYYLDGKMTSFDRGEEVRRFQEEKGPCAFLLSLKAGGVGLNLTEADTVFLLDPWWNDAVEQQAIDRVHRLGQTKHILVRRFILVNSIEEKILQIKQQKSFLVSQVLQASGEEINWSAEDLFHLLV